MAKVTNASRPLTQPGIVKIYPSLSQHRPLRHARHVGHPKAQRQEQDLRLADREPADRSSRLPTAGYNAQFEGFQLSNALAQPTIRQNNVTQISERDATVSGTQEEADAAGKGSEMAHQMALAAKVLKSDMVIRALLPPAAGRRQRHRPYRPHHRRLRPLGRAGGDTQNWPSSRSRRRSRWRRHRPPNPRHRRLRRGRRRLPDPGLGSHARPGHAAGLHQWREPKTVGRSARAKADDIHVRGT